MTTELCPDCGRPRLLNLKRYRLRQSTGDHKKVCGRELNAPECELECNYTTIARLRAELASARELSEEESADTNEDAELLRGYIRFYSGAVFDSPAKAALERITALAIRAKKAGE